MLTILACLLALAVLVLARQRAEIIRLRVERRLAHVPHVPQGSWEAFRLLSAAPAGGRLRGA